MAGGGEGRKGSATPLASLFSAEESRKAVEKVNEYIAERHKELDQLNIFIADNNALKKLVQSLPDELSHDIMVPFGKAAFFPGKMIHTNEFLVFLGEGYYAERASKQTVDILQRRGKTLTSKVDALKSIITDLQAEASFFNYTAAEASEGLVEIREEYDKDLPERCFEPEPFEDEKGKMAGQSEDFDRLMARLDELEKEEEMAESSEDEDASPEIPGAESHLEQVTALHSIHDRGVLTTELDKLQVDEVEPSASNPSSLSTKNLEEKRTAACHKPKEKHVTFASQNECIPKGVQSAIELPCLTLTVIVSLSDVGLLVQTNSALKTMDNKHELAVRNKKCEGMSVAFTGGPYQGIGYPNNCIVKLMFHVDGWVGCASAVNLCWVSSAAPRDHFDKFGSSSTRKAFTGSVIERGFDIPTGPQSGLSEEGSA